MICFFAGNVFLAWYVFLGSISDNPATQCPEPDICKYNYFLQFWFSFQKSFVQNPANPYFLKVSDMILLTIFQDNPHKALHVIVKQEEEEILVEVTKISVWGVFIK